MKKPFTLFIAILCLVFSVAQAQTPTEKIPKRAFFPEGLQWQMMDQVALNVQKIRDAGTPAQKKLAENIWAKEISQAQPNTLTKEGGKLPSLIILSPIVDVGGKKIVFSGYDSMGTPLCEPPPNGPFVDPDYKPPMYSTCTLRIVAFDVANNTKIVKNVDNFCYLINSDDDPNIPLAKNHTDFAFDRKTNTAYFRVVQYGKHAPECDRQFTIS